ncbi:hypothetical protein F5Y17DRAFT_452685 [Xylariaceae sp. FL0594]|nr:hypothetical protein F5Y17DRAFT_452685 [Xylariaceae sp. FL0594]
MLVQQGLEIWGIINGTGNPTPEFTAPELVVQAKLLVAASTTWIFSTTTVKLAVLALYMRIFTTAAFKKWAIALMVLTSSFGITFIIVFVTRCHPVSQGWNPVPGGWCGPVMVTELTSISLNLVTDTAIVILPMPWLWHLHLPTGKKILIMIMFSFGFATIAIMAYRIEQAVHADPDPLIAIARVGLLSNVELWLGIIVACLPTMAPFVRTYVQPHLSTLSRKIYGSTNPSVRPGVAPAHLGEFRGNNRMVAKGRSNYSELSETFVDPAQYRDQVRLTDYTMAKSARSHIESV